MCSQSHQRVSMVVLVSIFTGLPTQAQTIPTFTPVGDLPGRMDSSRALGISRDGLVAVGQSSSSNGTEAFRWTAPGGISGLGDVANGAFASVANDTSFDGSVIVGMGTNAVGPVAFMYSNGIMTQLGYFMGGGWASAASGVSGDGSIVVGSAEAADHDSMAFRWTNATGMVAIPRLPGKNSGQAEAISSDGSTIVGVSGDLAFYWTSELGTVSLGLAAPWTSSRALGCSEHGETIVGYGVPTGQISEAFRWNSTSGFEKLLDLPGGDQKCLANDVSADASIVVGQGSTDAVNQSDLGRRAVVWLAGSSEPVDLQQYLIDLGVQGLDGWILEAATAISADGTTIAGFGFSPQMEGGWIVSGLHLLGCPADFNHDRYVNGNDYDAFASLFESGDIGADFNHDGYVNGNDYDAFASSFENGC